jgi:hypothetical protein
MLARTALTHDGSSCAVSTATAASFDFTGEDWPKSAFGHELLQTDTLLKSCSTAAPNENVKRKVS